MLTSRILKPSSLWLIPLVALMVVGVACGSAAEPQQDTTAAEPAATAAPVVKAEPKTAPDEKMLADGMMGKGEKVTVLVADVQNKIMFPPLAGGSDLKYLRMMFDDMFGSKGGGGEIINGVAKDWEMSEDGRTWVVTVNEGINFHNGDVLDIDDVIYSLGMDRSEVALRLLDSGCFEPRDTAYVKYTESLEKGPGPNQYTYTQNRAAPNFPFNFSQNNQGIKALVLSQDYMVPMEASCFKAFETTPVGTGPFKYVDHQLGISYEFERFDDYFYHPANGYSEDRRAKFEFLEIQVVLEGATRLAALQSGEADLIEGNVQLLSKMESAEGVQIVWQDEIAHSWFVNVDCWEPDMWCYKKEARQAIQYATDVKLIADELYGRGATAKGWAWATGNALGYGPNLDHFPYDPAKAKELWAQAGLEGQTIEIGLWTWESGGFPFLPQVAELVAKDWEKNLGIKATVNVGDQQAIKKSWNNRELAGDLLIRENEARFDGTSITRGGFTNPDIAWRGIKDPRVEPWKRIADRAGIALDDLNTETRDKSFNEAYVFLRDEAYYWGPFYSNLPWGVGSRIKTYEPWSLVPYFTAVWTIELN
ncbi:MAG: ABC transporter substrate-binding protein [Chloroflexi bacterium]|nr:ABC transporter substrate-binding protein [Chloroflexota bacterium]